jgi:glycosyltransferase involved in cell wall biosynthesis
VVSIDSLCRALKCDSLEVAVACDLEAGDTTWALNRLRSKWYGIRSPLGYELGYPVYRGWDIVAGIHDVLAHFRPDVIIVDGASPGPYLLAKAISEAHRKLFYYVRDVEFSNHGGPLNHLSSASFIANSHFTAKCLRDTYGIESAVIPPLIEPDRYRVTPDGTNILLVNPGLVKGGVLALEIAEARHHIPFVFLEAWPSNASLTALKERAKQAGNVRWMRPVKDMRRVYKETRILLVPSQWREAWGRVVTETQLSGIPTIASNIGGLPESVGPGGMLVMPDAPLEEWLAAIDKLWTDKSEWNRYSTEALRHASRPAISVQEIGAQIIRVTSDES